MATFDGGNASSGAPTTTYDGGDASTTSFTPLGDGGDAAGSAGPPPPPTYDLAGTGDGTSDAAATLVATAPTGLVGLADVGSDATGALALLAPLALDGAASGSADAAGEHTLTAPAVALDLAGAAEATSSAIGWLDGASPVVLTGHTASLLLEPRLGAAIAPPVVDLIVLNPGLIQAPTSLQIMVNNATPGAELRFYIDDHTEADWTETADADGSLDQTSIPVYEEDGEKGDHTIRLETDENGADTEHFTFEQDPPSHPVVQPDDTPPVAIPGAAGRWVLQDLKPGGLGSWVMPRNPSSMTSPQLSKSVAVGHTTSAAEGQWSLSVAGVDVIDWTIRGYYDTQDQYHQLAAYAALNRRFYVIDHRGRAWIVAVRSYVPTPRKRQSDAVSPDNDWAGDYELTFALLGQSPQEPR